MRAESPKGWLTLEELCEKAGVDHTVLFYNSQFGVAISKLRELGILREEKRNVTDADGWDRVLEFVRVSHPNLWEEVVGTLRHTESLCRLHKPNDIIEIKSYTEYVKVFGTAPAQRDYFSASGQVSTKRLT